MKIDRGVSEREREKAYITTQHNNRQGERQDKEPDKKWPVAKNTKKTYREGRQDGRQHHTIQPHNEHTIHYENGAKERHKIDKDRDRREPDERKGAKGLSTSFLENRRT